jgi:hypothetical protein
LAYRVCYILLLQAGSHEFPRDGDQLVGRMTGTMEIDGVKSKFESFMFAQIEEATGRMIL